MDPPRSAIALLRSLRFAPAQGRPGPWWQGRWTRPGAPDAGRVELTPEGALRGALLHGPLPALPALPAPPPPPARTARSALPARPGVPPLTPAGLDPVAGTLPSVAALEAEQARWARALAEGEAIEALAAACRLAEWRVADRPRWFEAAEFRWHRCGARGDVLFAPLLARELRWLYELGDPAFGLGFQALLALCARTPSCWRWASWLGDPFGLPLDPPPPSGQELALRVGPWEVSAAVAWVPPGRRRHRYHGPGRAGRAAAQG